MEKDELLNELKVKTKDFLRTVSNDNVYESYDGMINILLPYKGAISRDDIYNVFSAVDDEMRLDSAQEEIIIDISNRLFGACRPGKKIEWNP